MSTGMSTLHTAHDCMDHRQRGMAEGDDVFVERCTLCGRVRMERGDGKRPMAWFRAPSKIDPTFPWRYAYDDPRPGKEGDPEIWKYPEEMIPDAD